MIRSLRPSGIRRRRVARAVAASIGGLFLVQMGVALAYWTASDSSNPGGAVADALPAGATPSAATAPGDATTIGVTFATSATTTSGRTITTYTVRRYATGSPSVSKTFTCTTPVTSSTCKDTSVPSGSWQYTDAPTISLWQGAESSKSASVISDSTAPTSTITFPVASTSYNTAGFNAGCNTSPFNVSSAICGTATDPGTAPSGVAGVKVSVQAPSANYWNGSGFTSSTEAKFDATFSNGNWTLSFAGSRFSVDGTYIVRSYATDAAGNSQAAATSTSFQIDNTLPAAVAPTASAVTTFGSNPVWVNNEVVTLTDVPTDTAGSGVKSVAYYYCPTSVTTCTAANGTSIGSSDTASGNFSVASSAPLAGDGGYKVVAVATDNAGNTSSASTATLVGVDTTAPTVSRPIVNGNS